MLVVLDVDLPASVVEQRLTDGGRGRDALTDHPVHALMDHRLAVEVRGVDEAGGAVDAPAVGAGLLEDVLGGVQHPVRCAHGAVDECAAQLDGQSRPLQAVARRDAVGPEGVGRLVAVVVEPRFPGGAVVLGQAPAVLAGLDVDREVDDLQRPLQPTHLAGDVGGGKVGLNRVHGGVDAPVVLRVGEVEGIGLDRHLLRLVPPVAVLDRHGVAQQLVGTGPVGGRRCRRSQQHECVLVALLAGLGIDRDAAPLGVGLGADRRVPAAVGRVAQGTVQGTHAVVGVTPAAGDAHERPQGEGEGHAAGDPQLDGMGEVHLTVLADPPESGGHLRGARVVQQRMRLVGQPTLVLGGAEPSQSHESSLIRWGSKAIDPPHTDQCSGLLSAALFHARSAFPGPTAPRPAYFCFGQADSPCASASRALIAPVDQRLSPSHRALLPTPTGIESEASISTVV